MSFNIFFVFAYYIKQIDCILPCVCSVIHVDHRRCRNVVRTSVTHLPNVLCATFLCLSHFDVICDLHVLHGIYLFVQWTETCTE